MTAEEDAWGPTILDHVSAVAGRRVETMTLREARAAFERAYFEGLLIIHGGKVSVVQGCAGMGDRSAVYRKMRELGIVVDLVRRKARKTGSEGC